MTGTPSRTATAGYREGPWRGSCKQSPGLRNTNRIRGDQRRTRGLIYLKSKVIEYRWGYMRRVDGANGTRLTPGGLHVCLELGCS